MEPRNRRVGQFTKATISLSAGRMVALREIAFGMGYVVPSGGYAGMGNVSELISRLADGTVDMDDLAAKVDEQLKRRGATMLDGPLGV